MAPAIHQQEMAVASRTEQIAQGAQYSISQQRNRRPLYPSSIQVDHGQSSSRSSLTGAGNRGGSRAGQTRLSHTSSAPLQGNYRKDLHYNLLGVGSQFANFGAARPYQTSLCAEISAENQPIHENHLRTGRRSADEYELEVLGSTLDTDPVDGGNSQQQDLE